jgi:uracil-DNA glycosylase family 4|tara:strand:- start:8316 stop:9020 length:705 start_codon:yes stop_codon:yes gene_type:complete
MTLSNKNQNDKLNFELAYSYNVEYNFSNTPLNRFNKSVTNHERLDLLKKLENKISSIKDCKLKSNSSKIVFSDGNIFSDIMIVGEGPGAKEDELGKPFVGDAGILLNKMLKAINIRRERIYITNVVNFRPPNNRKPEMDEINRYSIFLREHISIINPKLIILMGSTAMEALFGNKAKISKERGKWKEVIINTKTFLSIITFHPAYLLRQPDQKKFSWIDLKIVKKKIEELKIKI